MPLIYTYLQTQFASNVWYNQFSQIRVAERRTGLGHDVITHAWHMSPEWLYFSEHWLTKPPSWNRWNMNVAVYISVTVCRNHSHALLPGKTLAAGIIICIINCMHKWQYLRNIRRPPWAILLRTTREQPCS